MTQKKLPRGLMERTAKQFSISQKAVKNIWKRGLASIKKQQEKLLGVTGIEDHVSLATLTIDGQVIRPDLRSDRATNCGRKPVYDLNKISEMLNALPIDQKKSYGQAAKHLGVSKTYLLHAMRKYNPERLAAEKEPELTLQLKQQRVLRDKVRQEVIRQQKMLNGGVSGRARKNQNKNNTNIDNIENDEQSDDERQQPNDERVSADTNPPSQHHETQQLLGDELRPPSPMNESYWY
jgi:hypothetical protein